MIRAVIDIGTNTAHILIGEVVDGKIIKVIHKRRCYTFLGDDGLDFISEAAIHRLLEALTQFEKDIKQHDCTDVRIFATEGLRSAKNGPGIQRDLEKRFKWPISIITGLQESELIYKGVLQAADLSKGNYLIMDIGGGSVEFIASKNGKKIFNESFPIGISRLFQKFHFNDPIEVQEFAKIGTYLSHVLQNLWRTLETAKESYQLVGCAGTFEIFLDHGALNNHEISIKTVNTSRVQNLLSQVLDKNLEERQMVDDLPKERAKYIVVALVLIQYMIKELKSSSFKVCKYALKEGALVSDF